MEESIVKKRVVGVEISSAKTTYAIVNVKGEILALDSFPTQDYPDINDFVATLCERIVGFVESHGGYNTIRSVGVSAPSANFMTGCIENAPNMPWKGVVPLSVMLSERLGLAVALANDATVMALGEHAFGCAHGMRDFVVITLGSGMGSCFFSNGLIHKGMDGFAGEIGHTCAVVGGRQCSCGNKGCLETYTAAKGVMQTAKEIMVESDKPSLMRQAERLTPKMITEFCEQGDELAIEVYRRTGEILGCGIANYASCVDPEAFIFMGGVAKAGHWLLDPARESFEKHVFHNIKGKVKFLTSDLNSDQCEVLGASVLAWEVREYSLFK